MCAAYSLEKSFGRLFRRWPTNAIAGAVIPPVWGIIACMQCNEQTYINIYIQEARFISAVAVAIVLGAGGLKVVYAHPPTIGQTLHVQQRDTPSKTIQG